MSIFKNLGNLGNLAGIVKQAQEMGSKLQALNEQLKTKRVVGSAGGNMVEAEVNGLGQVLRISIDPEFFAKMDRELLEDLLPAAVNQALGKAKDLHAEVMKELTGGMELPPGLSDMLSKTGGPGGIGPGGFIDETQF
ncbi:MAG: YbaB/EbfC family nucleoid-associated protein [Planctomycetota bacterium]|nr:YbaB/EbfC family nucleoid-associated protein [Planctomycetota bacterium]